MPKKEPKMDVYISKSAPYAQPILKHLRQLMHTACPEVEEKMKWSFPHFDYKGMMCSMAAFKQHCSFSFWKASIMSDPKKILQQQGETAMGHFGKITSLKDLPSDKIIISFIKQAKKLNEEGIKVPKAAPKPKTEVIVPDYFIALLKKNKKALSNFENFSYSHRKEYVEWIVEAKTEATRNKRMQTALEWIGEGKGRNWKYERNS